MSDQKGRVAPGSLFDSCGCVGGKVFHISGSNLLALKVFKVL